MSLELFLKKYQVLGWILLEFRNAWFTTEFDEGSIMVITYWLTHVSKIIAGNNTEIERVKVFENFFLIYFRATPRTC